MLPVPYYDNYIVYRIPFDIQHFVEGDYLCSTTEPKLERYKVKFKQYNEKGDVVATGNSGIDGDFNHLWTSVREFSLESGHGLSSETKLDIVRPGRYTSALKINF